MRHFPTTIADIIKKSELNLNNLSQASGLSNAYLGKLVQGKINQPGKDKIASILLALNYTISEINSVLAEYDYRQLHEDDIPDILRNNRSRKIVGGNLPQYDHIYFDLLLVALERIGGNKILVKNRPSGSLMPHELYLLKEYPYESNDAAAVFRYNLTKQILVERSDIQQCNFRKGFKSTTYICRSCLEEYVDRHLNINDQPNNSRRVELVIRYFANALSLSLKRPEEHRVFIIDRCPYFHFLIQDADGNTPRVSYPGRKLHTFNNESDKRMLEGFTTDLTTIVSHFRHEVDMCDRCVTEDNRTRFPDIFVERIFQIFDSYALTSVLQERLDQLMANNDLTFW